MLVTADAGPATSVGHLWLTDFRCLSDIDVELASGLTVLQGANGQGKTSLLEAIGWVARARSFRGVTDAMLVRSCATEAIVRAEVTNSERPQLFEALVPAVATAYETLALDMRPITATYVSESSPVPLTAADADTIEDQLRETLERRRRAEIDRGLTLVGPHRDELHLMIDGLDAR